jgi:hypothetical protein
MVDETKSTLTLKLDKQSLASSSMQSLSDVTYKLGSKDPGTARILLEET